MNRVLFVDLGLSASNADLIDQMRLMKTVREEGRYDFIVCTIRGFDADPRELAEIVEVRAFCRRLMTLGFPSYLDVTTFAPVESVPDIARTAWGALEVWLCSEGRLKPGTELTKELVDEMSAMLETSNERADKTLAGVE